MRLAWTLEQTSIQVAAASELSLEIPIRIGSATVLSTSRATKRFGLFRAYVIVDASLRFNAVLPLLPVLSSRRPRSTHDQRGEFDAAVRLFQ